MKKYYDCPTQNEECPYWDWKRHKCRMATDEGMGPAGECDEYDTFNPEEDEDE